MRPREAVVYIPEDDIDCDDGLLARRGVVHIERRAYKFGGVLRKLKDVLERAAEGAVVVFARQEHAAALSRWAIKREFVGEETCRLVPIIQGDMAYRDGVLLDEGPTVHLLDRWRAARHNGRIPTAEYHSETAGDVFPRGDDGGFAERFLRSRRNGRDT